MAIQATETHTRPRLLPSTVAVLVGFFTVAILSLGTDQVLHMLDVYPPWGQPMFSTRLNALALSYRIVYTVFGAYLTARLAPRNPMRHALILGAIGFAVGLTGAIAAIPLDLGPSWYPIAIVLTALPCAWLGGVLHCNRTRSM